MSISSNYPAVRPTLLLDFANTKTLDPRITFTRASTATYYDGKTVAKAEENLLPRSQEFEAGSWASGGSFNTSVTANSTTAPDGTTTADTITATGGTSLVKRILQSVTLTSGTYTFSVFAKADTHSFIQFFYSGSGFDYANFDLSTGTVGNVSGTSTITSFGNGWYRCTHTFTANANTFANIAFVDSNTAPRSASTSTTGNVYLWGAQLEQRSSVTAYTPTTTTPITNYIPQLMTAASGVARFDHNPTTDESLGLLMEETRTNQFTYSDDFTNASWIKARTTISSNTIISPDGTLNGDKLVEDTTASNSHFIEKTYSTTSGTVYTFTVYAKAGERTKTVLQANTTVNHSCIFDLAAGTASTGNNCTGSISPVGNGWYRCSMVLTASTTGTSYFDIFVYTTTSTYTGDGWSGIYIWGAQLEAGAFATSYIPTIASTVTRADDVASMAGTNFSSWYSSNEGTLYVQVNTPQLSAAKRYFQIDDGTDSVFMSTGNTTTQTRFRGTAFGGTAQYDLNTGTNSINSVVKAAGAYKANDFALSVSGSAVVTDTAGAIFTPTTLRLGQATAGSLLNGCISKFAYYPKRLSDNQLQALTTI